jgi:hypothetical protein
LKIVPLIATAIDENYSGIALTNYPNFIKTYNDDNSEVEHILVNSFPILILHGVHSKPNKQWHDQLTNVSEDHRHQAPNQ